MAESSDNTMEEFNLDKVNKFISTKIEEQMGLLFDRLQQSGLSPVKKTPKKDIERRKSGLFHPGTTYLERSGVENDDEALSKGEAKRQVETVNALHPSHMITEAEMIQVLSIYTMMIWKRKVDAINVNSLIQVKIQSYIPPRLMEKIWIAECRRDDTWDHPQEYLYHLPHEKFMKIVARTLRPKTIEEYEDQLLHCLPKMKSIQKNITVTSPDWDTLMYEHVAKHFQVLREFDDFVRQGTTKAEQSNLPDLTLYKSDKTAKGIGVYGIGLSFLGTQLGPDFRRFLDDEKIRECAGDMDAFYDLVMQANQKLYDKAESNRIEFHKIQPRRSADQLAKLADGLASEDINGSSESQLRESAKLDTPSAFVENESASGIVVSDDETDPVATLQFVKTYNTKQPERVLPCYKYFDGRCTAGASCGYSHDKAVHIAYGKEQLKRLVASQYVTAEDLFQAANDLRNSQPKQHKSTDAPPKPPEKSLHTRPLEPPDAQDAIRLPTGRGNGQIRLYTGEKLTSGPPSAENSVDN